MRPYEYHVSYENQLYFAHTLVGAARLVLQLAGGRIYRSKYHLLRGWIYVPIKADEQAEAVAEARANKNLENATMGKKNDKTFAVEDYTPTPLSEYTDIELTRKIRLTTNLHETVVLYDGLVQGYAAELREVIAELDTELTKRGIPWPEGVRR